MKNKYEINLDLYMKNSMQVKLYYFEDEIYGQILMHSENFIFIREIKDWHYDGYIIFPKRTISNIDYGEIEKFRQNILNPLSYKDMKCTFNWLNITSFETIFRSLKNVYNEICIEGADEEVNQFMLGKISTYNNNNLFINKLNIYAKLNLDEIQIPVEDITSITFKDEYSTKLFNYYKHKSCTHKI